MIELPSDVTRVALAGDWHGDTRYARKAIAYAHTRGAEGVIHLGDFGIWPGSAGEGFLKAVNNFLTERGMWLGVVDGNHDDHWQLRDIPVAPSGVRPLSSRICHLPRGFRWEWSGHSWMSLGGAVSLDKEQRRTGVSWWPEEAISGIEAEKAVAEGPVDVLVTHDIAAGVPVPGLSSGWNIHALAQADAHRRLLRQIAELVQPVRWWHGHMHVNYQHEERFGDVWCTVHGLNCNGFPLRENVVVVLTENLAEQS